MSPLPTTAADLDRTSTRPIRAQLVDAVIAAIRSGALRTDERLPSSRRLAGQLRVSRSTVVSAWLELEGEGWVEPRPGSGTYVCARRPRGVGGRSGPAARPVSDRMPIDLRTGRIDPHLLTSRAWRAAWRLDIASAAPAPPAGEPALLDSLAAYLASARDVDTRPDDLVVCTGIAEALTLLALGLGWAGRRVVIEDPGYALVRRALTRLQVDVVPVDASDPDRFVATVMSSPEPPAALYLTPNHQYPLGHRLTAAHRQRLVTWAVGAGCVLIEDDYNSEYRFGAPPGDTLLAVAGDADVVYFGTMSKLLDPGLRLAYLRLPPALRESVHAARNDLGTSIARPVQLVVDRLLRSGEVSRHTARLRRVYGDRRAAMIAALRGLPAVSRVLDVDAGLHVVALLAPAVNAEALVAQAAARGIIISSLDEYRARPDPTRPGLVLGFAEHTPARIRAAISGLAGCPALAMDRPGWRGAAGPSRR